MTNQEKYKLLYVECMKENKPTTNEMHDLFQKILEEDFDDDPEKMSQFIQSIVDENTVKEPTEIDKLRQENEELKQRQEISEEALLMISDMVLGGMSNGM